jgi:hypothetical protein
MVISNTNAVDVSIHAVSPALIFSELLMNGRVGATSSTAQLGKEKKQAFKQHKNRADIFKQRARTATSIRIRATIKIAKDSGPFY